MRWRRILLLAAVAGIGLWVAFEFSARRMATTFASSLEPLASLTYSRAGFTLSGTMRLQDPRLTIHAGGSRGELSARIADIRGGGALWLLGAWFSPGSGPSDHLNIQTKALRFDPGDVASTIPAWVGLPSLVPFENLGCGSDPLGDKDRIRMGIDPQERADQFDYRLDRDSGALRVSMVLRSPGISEIRGFAEFSKFDATHWQDFSAQSLLRVDRVGISYVDPGYLVRRNQFCAQWLGSSTAEFIGRHVNAVKAFLVDHGIEPSEDLLGLYQKLVTRGGNLALTSLPESSWAPSEIAAYPRQNLLRQLNVTARLDDTPPIMFRLAFADPDRPWPIRSQEVPSETVFADSSAPPVSTASEEDTQILGPLRQDNAPVLSVIQQVSADPISAPAIGSEVEVPETSAAAVIPSSMPNSDPAPADQRVVASAPPPPKDSILALVWKPGVIERLPPQEEKKKNYSVIPLAELSAHLGRDVRFLTSNGKRVAGQLARVGPDHAVLKVRVGRGNAELSVPLDQIREVRLPLRRD